MMSLLALYHLFIFQIFTFLDSSLPHFMRTAQTTHLAVHLQPAAKPQSFFSKLKCALKRIMNHRGIMASLWCQTGLTSRTARLSTHSLKGRGKNVPRRARSTSKVGNKLIKIIITEKKESNKSPKCLMPGEVMSLSGNAEDSPGPDPAPEPELLPSDLSSDWPTGGEGW